MSLSLLSRSGNAEAIDTSALQIQKAPRMERTKETMSYAVPPEKRSLSFFELVASISFRLVGIGYVFIYLPYCFFWSN